MITISGLYIYPVKSCGGIEIGAAELNHRGFAGDRHRMVVDRNGKFMTQRNFPRLALIQPALLGVSLVLYGPKIGAIELSLSPTKQMQRRPVSVWNYSAEAVDEGDRVARWLSEVLRTACRLVRQPEDLHRPIDPAYRRKTSDEVSYADGFPFLLTTKESLDDFNRRAGRIYPMNRLRPNIVVTGSMPYDEDAWGALDIDGVGFRAVKPCSRCKTIRVNQETGETEDTSIIDALLAYRQGPDKQPYFGQNLIHADRGMLRVGSPVTILDRKQPMTFLAPSAA